MKANIHPNYVEATVTCACGNTWQTMSTRPNLRTDLCSQCHPFYTGEQRIVDTAGQVDRFMRRMGRRQAPQRGSTSQRAPVQTSASERPTVPQVASELSTEEPAGAAGVGPAATSTQSSAPIGEGMARQLDPESASR
jgi:large subunit ribosomal protein L31